MVRKPSMYMYSRKRKSICLPVRAHCYICFSVLHKYTKKCHCSSSAGQIPNSLFSPLNLKRPFPKTHSNLENHGFSFLGGVVGSSRFDHAVPGILLHRWRSVRSTSIRFGRCRWCWMIGSRFGWLLISLSGLRADQSTFGKHKVSPLFWLIRVLAHHVCQHFHPTIFLCSAVGVKVDGLTIGEANAESFFNKHVALFLLCESRLSSATTLARSLLLHERSLVVDKLACFGKVDCRSGLTSSLMISCKLRTVEGEKSTTPKLQFISTAIDEIKESAYWTVATLLA